MEMEKWKKFSLGYSRYGIRNIFISRRDEFTGE
jgi:hypothetical protein